MVGSMKTAPERSVFLLHACAHNPTGVDPTREQWGTIADVMLEKGHYAFFDCAYQGFASGNLDNDAWAVREFENRNVPMLVCQVSLRSLPSYTHKTHVVCQSFAKNAGLYGERVGALHVIASTTDASTRVRSQLAVLARSEISNPPAHGARLASLVFCTLFDLTD